MKVATDWKEYVVLSTYENVVDPIDDKYIDGDETIFEKDSLERIADDGQLMAYKHDGFWQCMDTQRDKEFLEKLWKKGESPWKKWD